MARGGDLDDWPLATARIVSCELVPGTGVLTDVYIPLEYRVQFAYSVDEKNLIGIYSTGSLQEVGSEILIRYNQAIPEQNTLAHVVEPAMQWAAVVVGVLTVGAFLLLVLRCIA